MAALATGDDRLTRILNRNMSTLPIEKKPSVSESVMKHISCYLGVNHTCRWKLKGCQALAQQNQANCANCDPWPKTQGGHHVHFTVKVI